MQINRFNFIRWFSNVYSENTINIPRANNRQKRVYMPVIALGEQFAFYINCDIAFSDSDFNNLRLDLVGPANTYTNIGALSKDNLSSGGYNIYASPTLNSVVPGQYQLMITNTVSSVMKCISNPVQVTTLARAEEITVSALYRNSRNRSKFRYTENPSFQNKIRLTTFLVDWNAEGSLEQYREVSTGVLRNEKLELDRKIKISTYYFDDGAHEAMAEMCVSDSIILNGRLYRAKGIYTGNIRANNSVSNGEVELYEVDFSKINKYGVLS